MTTFVVISNINKTSAVNQETFNQVRVRITKIDVTEDFNIPTINGIKFWIALSGQRMYGDWGGTFDNDNQYANDPNYSQSPGSNLGSSSSWYPALNSYDWVQLTPGSSSCGGNGYTICYSATDSHNPYTIDETSHWLYYKHQASGIQLYIWIKGAYCSSAVLGNCQTYTNGYTELPFYSWSWDNTYYNPSSYIWSFDPPTSGSNLNGKISLAFELSTD